jgi:hypothetical protein
MADSTGIFPRQDTAGGVPIRSDLDGSPLNPVDVENAYVPAPGFVTTCVMTALPTNCDSRIEPPQINALVSELVALAECFDADGPWDCTKLNNLCTMFTTWVSLNVFPPPVMDGVSIVGAGTEADPYRVGLVDGGTF